MFGKLALSLAALALAGSAALAQDNSNDDFDVAEWAGRYVGFIDGRDATLYIRHSGPGTSACEDSVTGRRVSGAWFSVTLIDQDRNAKLVRNCISQFHSGGPRDHRWRNLKLEHTGTGEVRNVGTFYLHTWDKNFISGHNSWRGRNYGRLFVAADRGIGRCDWPGHTTDPDCNF
jgi:hypothetical protein